MNECQYEHFFNKYIQMFFTCYFLHYIDIPAVMISSSISTHHIASVRLIYILYMYIINNEHK